MGIRDYINNSRLGQILNTSKLGRIVEGSYISEEGIPKPETIENKVIPGGGFWSLSGIRSTICVMHKTIHGVSAIIELYFAKDALLVKYEQEKPIPERRLPIAEGCIYGFRRRDSKTGIEILLKAKESEIYLEDFNSLLKERYKAEIIKKEVCDCHYLIEPKNKV